MWFEMVKDPRSGEWHRYNPHCSCLACCKTFRSKETHKESASGARSTYRGGKHTRKAGREAKDGMIVKQKRFSVGKSQREKEQRRALDNR